MRLGDILISILLIVAASPLMVLAIIIIRIDSPGSSLFVQKRVGKKGVLFDFYKLRTMVEDAERIGPCITAGNDPRITRIGRLLRWFKIDEIPQFFNVLKGDMSLVGPRPEVPKIVDGYSSEEREVLIVRPGIIGPSQIKFRDEAMRMPESGDIENFYVTKVMPLKLKIDLDYVRSRDPLKDLKIILKGVFVIIFTSIKLRYIFESRRRLLILFFDLIISLFSYVAAFALRFDWAVPVQNQRFILAALPCVAILRAPWLVYFGLYQSLWQYVGVQELFSIVKAVTIGSLMLPLIPFAFQMDFQPRSTLIIDWFLLIMMLGAMRIVFKLVTERMKRKGLKEESKNVLIIGANDTGEALVREFTRHSEFGIRAVAFLDDDPAKQGVIVHGVQVMGKTAQLSQIARIKRIDEVIIALEKISPGDIKSIMEDAKILNISTRIVPAVSAILSPEYLPWKIRPLDIADLLGRELVDVNVKEIRGYFANKVILITGAGGSIGGELARILHFATPRQLILIDRAESDLYQIEREMRDRSSGVDIRSYLTDILNDVEIDRIFSAHKPDIVYHAAAYKHVPLMEEHFKDAVMNNVLGTKIVSESASNSGVKKFVLISTDKAIKPHSVMGATKRIGELYLRGFTDSSTNFMTVRFGNVFNSHGSLVPLIKRQIEEGGPVTITDPNAKRYFMDITEAVFLILEATLLGIDSEIFILDMGQPIRIADLVQNLMQLMKVPPGQVPIKYIGLRPGEKMEEDLELDTEYALPTPHKKIKIWKSDECKSLELRVKIDELISHAKMNSERDVILERLQEIVPEYTPWQSHI